jgi:hypothetical protein
MSSLNALSGSATSAVSNHAYASAKGILGLTRSLAKELGPKIAINGVIATDLLRDLIQRREPELVAGIAMGRVGGARGRGQPRCLSCYRPECLHDRTAFYRRRFPMALLTGQRTVVKLLRADGFQLVRDAVDLRTEIDAAKRTLMSNLFGFAPKPHRLPRKLPRLKAIITILIRIAARSAYLQILICDFDKTSGRAQAVKLSRRLR